LGQSPSCERIARIAVPGRFMRKFLSLAAIVALVAVGVVLWHSSNSDHRVQSAQVPPPAPVVVAIAQTRDVPIILRGLGTVVPYNAVAVHSRVEGSIVKVAFHEGQYVHKGDVLFELDPRPFQAALDQAKAVLARDQASLANAQADLQRYAALLKQSFAPEQQYATQKALVAQDQANIQNDQAQIETAKLNLDYAVLRSPVDGITGIRLVDIGNLVQANSTQTLVNVTQIQPIYVQFSLPERQIPAIRASMAKAKPPVLAFDGTDRHQLAEGKLELIDNSVDQTTGMISARAVFQNADKALWPGQFVNAHLVLETVHNGITVPEAAVQPGPNGSYVYVVADDNRVEMHPVAVRQVEHDIALLSSGVAANDKVVILGQSKLQPGVKVVISKQQSVDAVAQASLAQTSPAKSNSASPHSGSAGK
jgi:membrane fusion protein, multidrug efflux system